MSAAIGLRQDFEADGLRRLAAAAKDADQARRLLALAAVYDGMNREEAARIGGMDRQTLRDWVHRFNEHGAEGLINAKSLAGHQSFRWSRKRNCGVSWKLAPIRRRMGSRAGAAWISSGFLANALALICPR